MSYIEPNGTIKILQSVPLDTTYNHTIYFSSKLSQQYYFNTKVKGYSQGTAGRYTLNEQSYSRPTRGWVRVNIPADDLYDCNYMMFQNSGSNGKWFYAFIDQVKYINISVSEIHYQIDPMQTWLPGDAYTLVDCFVEREHSATDNIGDNIVPEPVNTGLYVTGKAHKTGLFEPSTYGIVIMATCGLSSTGAQLLPAEGQFISGVYQSLDSKVFPNTADGIAAITQFFMTFPIFGNRDNIAYVGMLPSAMIPWKDATPPWEPIVPDEDEDEDEGDDPTSPYKVYKNSAGSISETLNRIKRVRLGPGVPLPGEDWIRLDLEVDGTETFCGYVPKNNKLYTYPYNYFIVTNQSGSQLEFQFEQFDNEIGPMFQLIADYGVQPTLLCAPYGYKEKRKESEIANWRESVWNNDAIANLDYAIYIRDFPRSSWATSDLIPKLLQATISTTMIAAGAATAAPAVMMAGVSGAGGTNPATSPSIDPFDTNVTNYSAMAGGSVTVSHPVNPAYKPVSSTPEQVPPIQKEDAARKIASVIGKQVLPYVSQGTPGQPNPLFPVEGIDFIFRKVFLDKQYAEIIDNYFTMFGYQTNKIKIPNISSRPHWNYIKTKDFQLTGSIPATYAKQICDIYNGGITFWKNANEIGNYRLDNSPVSSNGGGE